MKFEINRGCITGSLIVDDKNFDDYDKDEQEAIINHVLAALKDRIKNNNINLTSLIELCEVDSYDHGETCEQCGDTPETWIYNL